MIWFSWLFPQNLMRCFFKHLVIWGFRPQNQKVFHCWSWSEVSTMFQQSLRTIYRNGGVLTLWRLRGKGFCPRFHLQEVQVIIHGLQMLDHFVWAMEDHRDGYGRNVAWVFSPQMAPQGRHSPAKPLGAASCTWAQHGAAHFAAEVSA